MTYGILLVVVNAVNTWIGNEVCNMQKAYNIMDEKEMNEPITIPECRQLREVINTLTVAPLLTKREYIRLMVVINDVLERMEKEDAESV